ncbi:beta strand repeat-containing protein [Actinoplanes sp. NPDC051513]|uniref:beta strand repeat-containing protein n=1 Tax=Actinoplanes sp. NPDC051513 TaxID=3363908 RepID=UPI00378825F1
MGVRRASAALIVLVAVLLAAATLVTGRADAGVTTTSFNTRFDANTNGSILLRGNTLLTCIPPPAACGNAQTGSNTGANANNNTYAMAYTNADGNPLTFDDSTATLDMPPGSTVLFAGLYWGASSVSPLRNQVLFSTTGGTSYSPVASSSLYTNGAIYQGFADVTAQVAGAGNGVYGVANVQASIAMGSFAGWSLVVAYQNPAEDLRALRIYDGFAQVNPDDAQISVTGFETPHSGTVRAKIGAVAYEGDRGTTGDAFEVDGQPLSDGRNPADNFFNSTVSDSGALVGGRNPGYVNQLGFDVDQVDASGMFANAATSSTLTLTTSGDQYYPGVITFTIDLYAPKITTTLTGTDVNGGDLLAGDVIEYRIAVQNVGKDIADGVMLADAIPPYTSYVPGSLTLQGAPLTDASSDDAGSYAAGSAGFSLGSIPYLGSTWVTFRVVVQGGAPIGYAITNVVNVSYTGRTTSVNVAATGGSVATTVQPPHLDLAAALAVTPAYVQRAGTPVTVNYTATVTNASGGIEPAAVATFTLPPGVTPGPAPTGCSSAGQVVTCALGPLVAGTSASATIPATVDNTAAASPIASARATGNGVDTNAANDTATATLAVNSPPQAGDDTATTPPATPVTITVNGNDTDPDDAPATLLYSVVGGGPAHGVAVANADRTITYTPAAGWAGPDTFTYRVDDPHGGSDTATVTVTTQNAAPVANDDMVNTPTSTAVTIDVRQNDTDPNGDALTVVAVTQPASVLIGAVTFTGTGVTFTPFSAFPVFAGPATFTYTVRDPGGLTATATVSIDVANALPTAANDVLSVTYAAARAGVTAPAAVNDTDPNHDTLTVIAVGGPAAGTGATSLLAGVVTYTAPVGFSGNATFTYTISDGHGGTDTATVTVTVGDAPPVAQPFTVTTGYRAALTLDVLAVATDPNGDTSSVSGVTAPAHGVVTRDPFGMITYLPDVAYSGTDSFTYTIDDGHGGTDTANVTVTVANGVAAARADAATGPGGAPVTIDVLANDDPDPNGDPITYAIDVVPGHGIAGFDAGHRIVYTPDAGFLGVDTLRYTTDDGRGGLVGAIVTINVINTAPVARPDTSATDTNTDLTVPVLANDDDPNGDPVTLTAVAVGGHGTVTANPGGTVTYVPDTGFYGNDSFVYSIRDPSGLTDSALVTVIVRNAAPMANDDTYTARPGVPIVLPVLANDVDPNTGQAIEVVSATATAKGMLTFSGGVLTYRADPGTVGTDGFDYVLTDDLSQTDTGHVTITIDGSPSAVGDAVSIPADTAVDIAVTANDTDPESQLLTVTTVGTPGHGSTKINANGTVEYRPHPGFFGTDTFGYAIVDSVGNTSSAQVTVQVANAVPVARTDTAALLSDRTVLVDVLANDTDANPGQTLAIASAGTPAHGTATLESGQIRYVAAAGYVGPDTFTYAIGDGNGGAATGTVAITVSNGVPVAVPDSRTTPYQHAIAVDVLTNDLDPGGTLDVTAVTTPDHGTATFAATAVTYTPPAGFAGIATLAYTATDDAGHRTTADVEILVGVPPSVPNKQVTVLDGRSVGIGLPNTGQDGRPVSLVRIGGPAHGTARINADGTVTYVPFPGFAGTDSFSYEVVDADGNVAQGMVYVIVPAVPVIPPPTTAPTTPPPSPSPTPRPSGSPTPAPGHGTPAPGHGTPAPGHGTPPRRNRPPVAVDDRVRVAAGDSVVIRPLLNDRDPDGDALTIMTIRKPRHGTAAMTATTVTYTADGLDEAAEIYAAAADALGYTVGDGRGGRSTGSVTIHVVPVADLPTTGHDVLAVVRAGLLAVAAGGTLWWLGERPRPGRHRR